MALLSGGLKDKEFDIRMVQRGLNKGLILLDEVEKNLKKLPDDSENAEYVNVETFFEGLSTNKAGLRD